MNHLLSDLFGNLAVVYSLLFVLVATVINKLNNHKPGE